jgi:hypothetical protein
LRHLPRKAAADIDLSIAGEEEIGLHGRSRVRRDGAPYRGIGIARKIVGISGRARSSLATFSRCADSSSAARRFARS